MIILSVTKSGIMKSFYNHLEFFIIRVGKSNPYWPKQKRDVLTHVTKRKSRAKLGEGNGTPLQYSCLENPMDGGAW